MIWNDHSKYEGQHALLSPSQHSWVNYTPEKLRTVLENKKRAEHGTKLHAMAKELIDERIKLPDNGETFNMYVNDAIEYEMSTEILLFYSPLCFGTADAISFRNNKLRIHDYKSGDKVASILQLMIYAALFCIEYKKEPQTIFIELRIYQNGEIIKEVPDVTEIANLIKTIKTSDLEASKIINLK